MNQTTSGAQPAGSAPPGKSSKDLRPDLVAIVERLQAVEQELQVLHEQNTALKNAILMLEEEQGPPRFPKADEVYEDAMSPGFTYRIVFMDIETIRYEQLRNDRIVARDQIPTHSWPRFHRQRTLRRAT